MNKRTFLTVLAGLVLATGPTGHAQKPNMHVEVHNPAKFDSGEEELDSNPGQEVAEEHRPLLNLPRQSQSNNRPDEALQSGSGPLVNTVDGVGFDGVPASGYAPPDTNMAVGPNHIVQWVNVRFAIYDKQGNIQAGYPKPGNAFWAGFGGPCETQNSGDPIIQYDAAADRWIATQFTSSGPPFYECFAVSQTGNPGGAYNRYAYAFTDGFPDYPKITVWKNAYFASYNMFASTAGGWLGPRICAYDRAAMIAGTSAVQECFNPGVSYGSLLPSDLDGGTASAPPSNTGYFLDYGNNSLLLWRFTPNFVTPSSASLSGPISLPVAAFAPACAGGTCIPQPSGQKLDSLADRLMYRLAYRNFGGYEAMVVNQSVTAGTSVGIRWYEIRNPLTSPAVFQQGTYAPDATYRWMGSAAMDKSGNIAVGYSASSSTAVPSIRYTGRDSGDPLGTLQAEQVIITSGGSQTGGLSRWGDYAAMRIDPSDDCTFWFTTEYIPASGSFNWRTRIASFKFNSCGAAATPDFSVSATPGSQTVVQGNGTTYTASIAALNGFSGDVTLSTSGLPSGASASFSANPVSGGSGASTMTVSTLASTPAGTYTVTVTGTSGSLVHSTTVTLVVQAATAPANFTLSSVPTSRTVSARQSVDYVISVNPVNGFNSAVTFSVTGLPARTSASFSPASSTTGTTLTVKANPSAKPTTPTTLTITGIGGGLTRTVQVTLTIQ
jgi:hypothetical protein